MRSVAGRGSVFAIEVLAAAAPPRPDLPAAAPAQAETTDILLVEDDEVQGSALASILRGLGHRVSVAHDAASALAHDLEPVGLIITDYRLPGTTTGVELVTRARRATGRNLPAIIVTGDTQQTILIIGATIGCEVLHKPCSPELLLQAIARAVAPPAAPITQ